LKAQYAAVIAGLTVTASVATLNHINIDDILAAARPHAAKKST
jgi:mediator of RNA polymerase II transcription subunit 16